MSPHIATLRRGPDPSRAAAPLAVHRDPVAADREGADHALSPFGEPVERGGPARALFGRIGAVGGDLLHAMGRRLRARSDARRLHRLDDRLLADMGLSRGEIDARVRRRSADPRGPF